MQAKVYKAMFLALLVGLPLAAWRMAFVPRNVMAGKIETQVADKRERLKAVNKATATIGDLEKEIEALNKAINYLRAKLPSEKEIDKVLQEVWGLAERNHLVTKSIRTMDRKKLPADVAASMGQGEQPITIQLEGSFLGFYAFMQELEKQPRIMLVREMTMLKPEKAPEGYVSVEFIVTIFFENSENKPWQKTYAP
ncbi:MAG: type 4a pilus biogenesis protein PilO [Planctomycetota bacterium]|nr:type 4a pilus biogenesis protein PilO [Planctomycetota bacterium]